MINDKYLINKPIRVTGDLHRTYSDYEAKYLIKALQDVTLDEVITDFHNSHLFHAHIDKCSMPNFEAHFEALTTDNHNEFIIIHRIPSTD